MVQWFCMRYKSLYISQPTYAKQQDSLARGIPKFSKLFYWKFPFHLTFVPVFAEFLVDWFAFRKFKNVLAFLELFPENFCTMGAYLSTKHFEIFETGTNGTGNFLGKVPVNSESVEFPKSEPFNRKFRRFRDEGQMERKFPGKKF